MANSTFSFNDGSPQIIFSGSTISATSYGSNTSGLSQVILGSNATTISNNAFNGCSSLTSITFQSSITSIGNAILRNCTSITSIDMSMITNIINIGTNVFFGCSSLTNCILPPNITEIPDDTFHGCSFLTSVTFPSTSVTTLGNSVFQQCSALTTITLPSSITTIGTSVFEECINLTSCQLSSNLTNIDTHTFLNCSNLASIVIPPNVTTIGNNAFDGCAKLATISFENASSANNKLNNISQNSGFSTVNSSGSPAYPSVTFYNAPSSSDLTVSAQNIAWPSGTLITYNGGGSCFSEGTKILCLNHKFEEEYVPIQNLRKGDLVKSYLHGYRKIDLIGKGYSVTDPNDLNKILYKMIKNDSNNLIEDLIVTGGHSILVDDLGEYAEKTKEIFGEYKIIDDKFLLLTGITNEFVKMEEIKEFYYYHFILENNGNNDQRFGVWANGILTETPSKTGFLSYPFIII